MAPIECSLKEIIRVPAELSQSPWKDSTRQLTDRSKLTNTGSQKQLQLQLAKALALKHKFSFENTEVQQFDSLLVKG